MSDRNREPTGHASPDGNDRYANAPIGKLLGFDVLPGTSGRADVLLDTTDRHHNPFSQVHGGVIAAIADAAMGIAFGRSLAPEQTFATVDLSIQFIRPIRQGMVRATATLVERGLRVGFVRCEVRHEETGKRLATATCTCMVAASW